MESQYVMAANEYDTVMNLLWPFDIHTHVITQMADRVLLEPWAAVNELECAARWGVQLPYTNCE